MMTVMQSACSRAKTVSTTPSAGSCNNATFSRAEPVRNRSRSCRPWIYSNTPTNRTASRHRFFYLGRGFGLLSRHRFFISEEASVFSRDIAFFLGRGFGLLSRHRFFTSEEASVFSQDIALTPDNIRKSRPQKAKQFLQRARIQVADVCPSNFSPSAGPGAKTARRYRRKTFRPKFRVHPKNLEDPKFWANRFVLSAPGPADGRNFGPKKRNNF